jgi:hypothetical protein
VAGKLAKRYRSQVKAERSLRYGPERRQIRAEKRSAKAQRRSEVQGAKTTARVVQRAIDEIKPSIEGGTREAAAVVESTARSLAERMSSLSPAADAVKAASARDSAGSQRRLAESLATTTRELDQRKVDAAAGAAQGIQQARSRFRSTKSSLNDRLRQIAREEGVFGQARLGELTESARDRRTTRRGQTLTARERARDRRSRERVAAENREASARENAADRAAEAEGKTRATPKEVNAFRTKLEESRGTIVNLKKEGKSQAEVWRLLRTGRPQMTIRVNSQGEPLPQPVTVPAVPKMKDALAARLALQETYGGSISNRQAKRLRALGIRPKQLGLKVPSRPSRPAFNEAVNRSPGSDRAQG